jgi:hypothetical protein
MTLRRLKMVDLFQGFPAQLGVFIQGRGWMLFRPDQARAATGSFLWSSAFWYLLWPVPTLKLPTR